MYKIWTKNKWLLISIFTYSTIVVLFGETKEISQLVILGLSFFILPLLFNYKLDSNSIFRSIVVGLVIGFLVTPFSFGLSHSEYESILSFKYYSQILYWVLILSINIFYIAHRESYKRRKSKEDLSDERDNKIDKLVNPIKNRFFL